MSHAYPGIPPAPPPSEPVVATAIVLFREGPDGREVLLVRRGAERRFAGGFHAFPGGRLDPEDADVPVAGATGDDAALVACAARELFEETGVLLVRDAGRVSAADRKRDRSAILDGRLGLGAFLARARPHRGRRPPRAGGALGHARAPAAPLRRAPLPRGPPGRRDAPEVWPGELSGGGFVPVRRALERW